MHGYYGGAYAPGYSGDQSPTHTTTPTHKLGLTTLGQNLHRKLWPNCARYNGGLYWQPLRTYYRPTQQFHRSHLEALLSKKEGSQKMPSIGRVVGFIPSCYLYMTIILWDVRDGQEVRPLMESSQPIVFHTKVNCRWRRNFATNIWRKENLQDGAIPGGKKSL